ncbi:type I polyketide synthase [Micromonospora sp. NBS 11-29]|uniref:type I polyketide synthase n=1 Tax=Micromonospora sp. NBS 11-29 TaxID=1960879 RepID=UPI000B781E1B|nr:type I polyketide synthase [Micromonospora sp. NBS 11-29]
MDGVGTGGHRDPVAIVGIGCRLPGADDPRQYWELLRTGRDEVRDIPIHRIDRQRWADAVGAARDGIPARVGGFLRDIDLFDAGFFGLTPREAVRLDPQQRLMLVTIWEAMQDAGLSAASVRGSRTAVYSACLASDYWDIVRSAGLFDMHAALSNSAWGIPAGRISHLLDLRGPSMGIDATCSSSLLGVHLACRDLWSGEAEAALVTGANLIIGTDFYRVLADAEILSTEGRRRFGHALSDGYVRSEGVVSIVLKPLSAARRAGDRVYATIVGSGVSNNGHGGRSLAAPRADGQAETLRRAYLDAGIAPAEVDYVEAHGAGTPQGDLAELTALRAVVGAGRPVDRPCLIGSVKSNIGHIEAAAGLAGLVKVALSLRHRTVPATLYASQPHPVLVETPGLRLAGRTRSWPRRDRPAVAGVSSFGLSATNVHVVLTEAPADIDPDDCGTAPDVAVLPVSARDATALAELAEAYADLLDATPSARLRDICHSAAVRRDHYPWRVAATGGTPTEMARDLREQAALRRTPAVVDGDGEAARIVFVFSGQGSQWPGMARELLATDDRFRARMAECDAAIRAETGWSVLDHLLDQRPVDQDDQVQPLLWAVQVSLAEAWRGRGVTPDLVIGHSMGEIAAACVAGAMSLTDAAAVVCRRIRLLTRRDGAGAMVAVALGPEQATAAIAGFDERVSVGVVNSARSVVLAGEKTALDQVVASLEATGVPCRPVPVRYASHCALVEPMRAQLRAALAEVRPRELVVPMYSTALDRLVHGRELDAEYWMTGLRQPVRFHSALRSALADHRPTVIIEVSPHPVLLHAVEDVIEETAASAVAVASMSRDEPQAVTLARGLAAIYRHGGRVDWSTAAPGRLTDLPAYPWQNRRYWPDPTESVTSDPALGPTHRPGRELDREPGWHPVARAVTGAVAGGAALLSTVAATALDRTQRALTAIQGAVPPAGGQATPGIVVFDAEEQVTSALTALLQVDSTRIDPDTPLRDLGVDSLAATRLRAVLNWDELPRPAVPRLLNGTIREIATMVTHPAERTAPAAAGRAS